MAPTKTYRLIWDTETGRLIINPFTEYAEGSITTVGNGRGYYETNTEADVLNKMNTEGLHWVDSEVVPV